MQRPHHPADVAPDAWLASQLALDLDPEQALEVCTLPPALRDWLVDLALLKPLPLSMLIPDPAWLPPESIRFFHVDWRWTERLIDGAMAAGNLGYQDEALATQVIADVRAQVVARLHEKAGTPLAPDVPVPRAFPMTGMLMRSAIVSRWPRLAVRAFSDAEGGQPLRVMRRDRLGGSILLVLFPGEPKRVEIQEPYEGVQFGVEPVDGNDSAFTITLKRISGEWFEKQQDLDVMLRDGGNGVLKIREGSWEKGMMWKLLASLSNLGEFPFAPLPDSSALLALQLQQMPYVQVFQHQDGLDEDHPVFLNLHPSAG